MTTFIEELNKARDEIATKIGLLDSFDVVSTARVFEALKEHYPGCIFEGPVMEALPEPHSKGTEEYTFVVAKDREAFERHEADR